MITEELRDLLHAEPFKPVRIVLGDKQAFTVTHTNYLAVSPDRQSVVLYDERGRMRIINAQQIKLVEPVRRSRSRPAA